MGRWSRRVARLKTIERNGARLALMLHRFTEERRRCALVPGPAQIKVDGLAFGVHRAIKVHPATANLDVGFVSPPRSSYGAFVATPPLLEFLAVTDRPP